MSRIRRRTWVRTTIGVVLTGIMLFPAYWMVNISLTRDQDMRKSPPDLLPLHGTLAGYRTVPDDQLPYLGTSLVIGQGTVVLSVALSAPPVTRWPGCARAAAASSTSSCWPPR